jgi:hypothetical protein
MTIKPLQMDSGLRQNDDQGVQMDSGLRQNDG